MDIVRPGGTARSAAAVRAAVVATAEQVVETISSNPAYGHTSHLAVQLDGELVYDRHLRGPEQADVLSVTKTVLATLVGVTVRDRLLPALDQPLRLTLPFLEGTPPASTPGGSC